MNSKKQNAHKKMSFKRFLDSIKYSIQGLSYGYRNEQSLWLHGGASILAIILGFVLDISFNQWAIIIIALVVVLAVELLNTAIESTVDLVTKEFHPLAKIAKDTASAAEFILTLTSAIISLMIFIPRIIELL